MSDGGLSLFKFVQRGHQLIDLGRLEISEWHRVIKIIFKQMIESVDYIHSKQIAHFDVSLENFLINDIRIRIDHSQENEKIKFVVGKEDAVRVRLCDFGLAEYLGPDKYASGANIILSNKFCGKMNYKSPEVINEKRLFDPKKNDIWCLGISLFMMIIGVNPWQQAAASDPTFVQIMNGDIKSALKDANKLQYVDEDLVELFGAFFKYEKTRISMVRLRECGWSNN